MYSSGSFVKKKKKRKKKDLEVKTESHIDPNCNKMSKRGAQDRDLMMRIRITFLFVRLFKLPELGLISLVFPMNVIKPKDIGNNYANSINTLDLY